MIVLLTTLLGGIGLFLLGMILMSDGLKAAAGGALQGILERSTGTTFRAFASGAGLTALVQSSSATTLATIGFVSAGLLTFPSALGVIIGANVGTTSTGWIVALLGLKFSFGTVAFPFIGVGALLRLLSTGRRAHLGMALAGFGLIFVAIDVLQAAMGGLALQIDLGAFSADVLWGRLVLVVIGAVMTVLLQSSSAAVALTLTAVHSGAIGLGEAAFLVIGQNLGTTVKAALAAIGASVPARRTAAAHILFNILAAGLAFAAAGPLLALSLTLTDLGGTGDPAIALTIFHTAFNLATAILVMPFLRPFARGVARLIPERGPALTRHLDRSLLDLPEIAVESAGRTVADIAALAFAGTRERLSGRQPGRAVQEQLEQARLALGETHRFLGSIRMSHDAKEVYARRLALLHAADHLGRMVGSVMRDPVRTAGRPEIERAAASACAVLDAAVDGLRQPGDGPELAARLAELSAEQAEHRRLHRATLLRLTASGDISPEEAALDLETMRLIDRIVYHVWRIMHHLGGTPDDSIFEPEGEGAAEV
jgi:phosphate:Na+ symporter